VYEAAQAELDWRSIAEEVEDDLYEATREGGLHGMMQLEISDQDMINAVNAVARDFAEKRAAEMVGMKWVDGELVENPRAEWAISETTRDDLRRIIKQAFEDETPIS